MSKLPPAPSLINLIGVAGSGMSGIAGLLLELGYQVSGSDRVSTRETERLREQGLAFYCPQTAESVQGATAVVYSTAIKPGNPAYDAAVASGVPMLRRAEALAAIMGQKKGIVVGGMHGKTTTSSMCAHVLRAAGLRPSHYVGAEIPLLGANARWDAEGDYFVAEGDESDGTITLFHPTYSILLNVEEEHLDHYQNLAEIDATFEILLQQTTGAAIYCGSDAGARRVAERHARSRGPGFGISYGWEPDNDFSIACLEVQGQSSSFAVMHDGREIGRVILNIPGRHNVLNALSVISLATHLGVPFERISWALSTFRGAKRRFEVKLNNALVTLVDDYGHHPTEIAATLATARQYALQQGRQRVVCVFQPHRYTRTQLLRKEFGAAFVDADVVVVQDIYPASEPPIPGISGQTILDEVLAHEQRTKPEGSAVGKGNTGKGDAKVLLYHPNRATLHQAVGNLLRPGDLLITLGAGNVHEIGARLTEDLRHWDGITQALAEPEASLKLYEPMGRHTTMLIGGPAQYWAEPRSVAALSRLVHYARTEALPIRIVGRGSNLLVRDGGIRGLVIHPNKGEFDAVTHQTSDQGEPLLTCGAGVRLKKVANAALAAGLGGFEWMEGIPGNVGGALRMNAGAMGVETFDQVVSVRFLDGNGDLREKSRAEFEVHYRNVPEFHTACAVSATFRGVPHTPKDRIEAGLAASKEKRRTSQPIAASAGCIFQNPPTCPAGKLVDELGLKNTHVGAATVSPIHGNFIVNSGGATARDVLGLIQNIQKTAKQERGIELETEVQIIGQEQPV